jgi:hypothetical protein
MQEHDSENVDHTQEHGGRRPTPREGNAADQPRE